MGETDQKIHKPSARRLRKAAEDGQFPHSSDLAIALALVSGCVLIIGYAGDLLSKVVEIYQGFYQVSFHDPEAIRDSLSAVPVLVLQLVAPVALGVWLVSLAVSWIQSPKVARRNAFSEPLTQWSPGARFQELISWKSPLRLSFQLLRILAVLGVTWFGFEKLLTFAENSKSGELFTTAREVFSVYPATLLQVCMVILAFAVIDRLWQQKIWWDSIQMTPEELKQERRDVLGDPLLRKKRKQSHRKLISARSGVIPTEHRVADGRSR